MASKTFQHTGGHASMKMFAVLPAGLAPPLPGILLCGHGPPRVGSGQRPLYISQAAGARGRDAGETSTSSSSAWAGGLDPSLEVAVPKEQRPVNELAQLKNGQLYNWGTLELRDYALRLASVFTANFALIGGPIAFQTFDPAAQPLEFFLSGSTGCMLVVAALVVRIYLGWSYVGDRLLSATVPYEETGWYDGQVFVKPPEVLARDRLLGMYEVKPVLSKLRTTLIGTGGLLLVVSVVLAGLMKTGADVDGVYGRGAGRPGVEQMLPDGVLYSKSASGIISMNQLVYDDEMAAKEAAAIVRAIGDRPGYCGDRYYKALAGGAGQSC